MIFIAWYDDWIFLQDATELRWYNRADVMYQVCRIKFHGVIVLPQKLLEISTLIRINPVHVLYHNYIVFVGKKFPLLDFPADVNQYFILFLAYRP